MAFYQHNNAHNPYSNHFFQVAHPSLPYNGDIPDGITPGKQIWITGHIPHHSNKFIIDMLTRTGIAFHMSTRFDEGCIVRNHEQGDWGREERHGHFPYFRGQPFELVISVDHNKYQVSVNGAHVFDFNHRVPVHEVTRFRIDGQVEIERIMFSGAGARNPRNHEIFNPPIPFVTPIPEGPTPGRLIQIQGRTHHHTKRFYFNLQNGGDPKTADLQFHASIRWDDDASSAPVVVRNARIHGQWGREERAANVFPFQKGTPFEILLLLEHHEWKMAVNGQHFVSFAHRDQFQKTDHLYICGDVEVTSIRQF